MRACVSRRWMIALAIVTLGVAWGTAIAEEAADTGKAKSDAKNESTVVADESCDVCEPKADGYELFTREWLTKDARARGGDGLGPVFNDSSCVACHNQGGPGGGGPDSKNVDVITAFANPQVQEGVRPPATLPEAMFRTLFGGAGGPVRETVHLTAVAANPVRHMTAGQKVDKELVKKQREELAKIHPGFLSARSVVLHKASTDPAYDAWRAQMRGEGHFAEFVVHLETGSLAAAADVEAEGLEAVEVDFSKSDEGNVQVIRKDETKAELQAPALVRTATAQQTLQRHRTAMQQFRSPTQGTQAQVGNFHFISSQRNPTALFGAGVIDAIPEEAIRENAKQTHKEFPEVKGRVAKLKDGRIGRFGWKGQTATLLDFTKTACAVELGLEVPGHTQAGLPNNPDYQPPGKDLNEPELMALVDYLRNLPPPVQAKPATRQEEQYLAEGQKHFAAVGCATCHTQNLGDAKGIYSDLLLHDMGQDLGDTGSYGIFIPNSPEEGADEPIPSLAQQAPLRELTQAEREKTIGALRQEWRTPPLWGVRDSGPYLHDGRAETLEQAIALHGGEAARSAQKFFELSSEEQMKVAAFLKSLRAPEPKGVLAAR